MNAGRWIAALLVITALGAGLLAWAEPDSTVAAPDSTAAAPESTAHPARAVPPDSVPPPAARDTVRAAPAGDPAKGRRIFTAKNCATCHKADGRGGVRLAGNPTPDWRDAKRMADPRYGDAYLRDCITNGKPKSGMPSWGKSRLVKSAEIADLIAYIHTFATPTGKK